METLYTVQEAEQAMSKAIKELSERCLAHCSPSCAQLAPALSAQTASSSLEKLPLIQRGLNQTDAQSGVQAGNHRFSDNVGGSI